MNPTTPLYKLNTAPFGRKLEAYFAAILEVTEMDRGATFPLQRFIKNFSGHVRNGRIVPAEGGYQLTPSGRSYFANRRSATRIERAEIDAMVRGITEGSGPDEWVAASSAAVRQITSAA